MKRKIKLHIAECLKRVVYWIKQNLNLHDTEGNVRNHSLINWQMKHLFLMGTEQKKPCRKGGRDSTVEAAVGSRQDLTGRPKLFSNSHCISEGPTKIRRWLVDLHMQGY